MIRTKFKKVGEIIIEYLEMRDYDFAVLSNKLENGRKLWEKFTICPKTYYLAPDDTIQKFEHWQNGYYYGRKNGEPVSYFEREVNRILATSDGKNYPDAQVLSIDDLLRCESVIKE